MTTTNRRSLADQLAAQAAEARRTRQRLGRIAAEARASVSELETHFAELDAVRDQLTPEELNRAFQSALEAVCRDVDEKRARIREVLNRPADQATGTTTTPRED